MKEASDGSTYPHFYSQLQGTANEMKRRFRKWPCGGDSRFSIYYEDPELEASYEIHGFGEKTAKEQRALGILFLVTNNLSTAEKYCKDFESAFGERLEDNKSSISEEEIKIWLRSKSVATK